MGKSIESSKPGKDSESMSIILVISTLDIGVITISSMEPISSNLKETASKELSKMGNKVWEPTTIPMATSFKEIGSMTSNMDKEKCSTPLERVMTATG